MENKVSGIGGWLIIPIIGIGVSIIFSALGLLDSLLFYELYYVYEFILIDSITLFLSCFLLLSIFGKQKLTINLSTVTYSWFIFVNLISLQIFPIIGSIVWMIYFRKSERVKNTFVKGDSKNGN